MCFGVYLKMCFFLYIVMNIVHMATPLLQLLNSFTSDLAFWSQKWVFDIEGQSGLCDLFLQTYKPQQIWVGSPVTEGKCLAESTGVQHP